MQSVPGMNIDLLAAPSDLSRFENRLLSMTIGEKTTIGRAYS